MFFLVAKVEVVIKIESHLRLAERVGDKKAARQFEVEAEKERSARRSGAVHVADYIRCIFHGRKSIHPSLPHDMGALGRA